MPVRRQHFVPQVYLKNWETQVTSRREPNKPFKGIYYYEKSNLEIGDGKNKDSILWEPRLYTIGYDFSFILPSCPMIEKDYIKQVEEKLRARQVNAFFNSKKLKTRKELAKNFLKLDEWEFRYKQYPFNIARKTAILNDIKGINSYVIEHAFDSVIENKWQQSLDEFIYQMENTIPLNGVDEIRQIDINAVLEIVKMVLFLICRNPLFNYLGILPIIKQIVLDNLPESSVNEGEGKENFIQNQMDAIWLTEIYRGLFNVPKGYFHTLKETAQSSFQLMLYKCEQDQGTFITSDTPAFEHISLIESINLNSIICPLTPEYLIMIMRGEDNSLSNVNFRGANNALIRKLNRIILNHSQGVIVSNYKHLGYIL